MNAMTVPSLRPPRRAAQPNDWPRHPRLRIAHRGFAAVLIIAAGALMVQASPTEAQPPAHASNSDTVAARLLSAYPDHIRDIRDGLIHWHDGTTLALDDGQATKSHAQWLAAPDVADMLAQPYPTGPLTSPPGQNVDPGRARNTAFFTKIYGDCRTGALTDRLVDVVWLPKKSGVKLKVTPINGVAKRLAAVSRALDELPASFDRYLVPPAGTYNCRTIAGTDRLSAHSYAIAIDIATNNADYWRWSKPGADGTHRWRNRVPEEIVAIFEAHGFIWGGKWYHYDTMHFEYRPELLPPTAPLD